MQPIELVKRDIVHQTLNHEFLMSYYLKSTHFLYHQWARIVLVVERGVSPQERMRRQRLYSQPMADGRPALVLKHQMTVSIRLHGLK